MKLDRQHADVLRLVSVIVFTLTLASSCRDSTMNKPEVEKAVSTLDDIGKKYLAGTLRDARSNMITSIALIHEYSVRHSEFQSALPIPYARLSLLERKAGNEALSRMYFEKSRYWRIIEREKIKKNLRR